MITVTTFATSNLMQIIIILLYNDTTFVFSRSRGHGWRAGGGVFPGGGGGGSACDERRSCETKLLFDALSALTIRVKRSSKQIKEYIRSSTKNIYIYSACTERVSGLE